VKGNIGSAGERIHRVPGQRYYDKTASLLDLFTSTKDLFLEAKDGKGPSH
jgi:hypothetical protein